MGNLDSSLLTLSCTLTSLCVEVPSTGRGQCAPHKYLVTTYLLVPGDRCRVPVICVLLLILNQLTPSRVRGRVALPQC